MKIGLTIHRIALFIFIINGLCVYEASADAKSDCSFVLANLTYQEKQYNNETKLKKLLNKLSKVNADNVSDNEEEIETLLQEIESSVPDRYVMQGALQMNPYGPNLPSYAQGRTTTFQQKNSALLKLLIKDIKEVVHSTLATYKKLAELNAE